MNFVMILFSLLTTSIVLSGFVLNYFEEILPVFLIKLIRYGKFSYKGDMCGFTQKLVIEVPKSWFRHFYWIGVLVFSLMFYEVTKTYIFDFYPSKVLVHFLNVACGTNRRAQSPAIRVYIALLLMSFQVYRRFYDTHFISVFGKNARINVAQYFVGLLHYPGSVLAIICEAPRFANISNQGSSTLKWSDITSFDFLAVMLFFWAWWHQHLITKLLANLRKDINGRIVTNTHKLPHGDWFNVLSCPHQTAEILMYFAITMLLWNNITWFFVFIWVLCNQILTILLSHRWYQNTFEDFPRNRKALIPYVY